MGLGVLVCIICLETCISCFFLLFSSSASKIYGAWRGNSKGGASGSGECDSEVWVLVNRFGWVEVACRTGAVEVVLQQRLTAPQCLQNRRSVKEKEQNKARRRERKEKGVSSISCCCCYAVGNRWRTTVCGSVESRRSLFISQVP